MLGELSVEPSSVRKQPHVLEVLTDSIATQLVAEARIARRGGATCVGEKIQFT